MGPKLSGAESHLKQNNQTTSPQNLTKRSQKQYPNAQQGILARTDSSRPDIRTLFSPVIPGCIKEILEKGQDRT